jgi:hypothetical protein
MGGPGARSGSTEPHTRTGVCTSLAAVYPFLGFSCCAVARLSFLVALAGSVGLHGHVDAIPRDRRPARVPHGRRRLFLFERAVRRSPQPLQANGPKVAVGFPRRDLPFGFPRAASPMAVASLEHRGALSRWTLHGGVSASTPGAGAANHPPLLSLLCKNRKLERYWNRHRPLTARIVMQQVDMRRSFSPWAVSWRQRAWRRSPN